MVHTPKKKLEILQLHGAVFNEDCRHIIITSIATMVQSSTVVVPITIYSPGQPIGSYLQVDYHRLLTWSASEAIFHITKRGYQSIGRKHLFRFGLEVLHWLPEYRTMPIDTIIATLLGTIPIDILSAAIIFHYHFLCISQSAHVPLTSVVQVLGIERYRYRRRRSDKKKAALRQRRFRLKVKLYESLKKKPVCTIKIHLGLVYDGYCPGLIKNQFRLSSYPIV